MYNFSIRNEPTYRSFPFIPSLSFDSTIIVIKSYEFKIKKNN